MTDLRDPSRLFESPETPPALAELLREAHGDGLDDAASSRVAAAVGSQIGGMGAGGTGGTSAGGAARQVTQGLSRLVPRAVAGVVGASALAGALWWIASPAAPVASEVGEGKAVVTASAVPSASASFLAPESDGPAGSPAGRSADLEPVPADTPGANVGLLSPAPSAAGRPGVGDVAAGRAKPRGAATSAASEVGGTSALLEEHRLLGAARKALAADPARTLALAGEHARRFPRGVLAQEREVLIIQALEQLGRHADAARRADEFSEQYPGSPHRDMLGVDGGSPKK